MVSSFHLSQTRAQVAIQRNVNEAEEDVHILKSHLTIGKDPIDGIERSP